MTGVGEKAIEKLKRGLSKRISEIFDNTGFEKIETVGKDIEFLGYRGEFDNVFVYQNVVILCEETASRSDHIADHVRKKKEFYETCKSEPERFIDTLRDSIPGFKKATRGYTSGEIIFVFLYCSLREVPTSQRKKYANLIEFWDSTQISYFFHLGKIVKKTARFEILTSLNIDHALVGNAASSTGNDTYNGMVLPEEASGFPRGHRIVSLVIDPEKLLRQAYVMRKYGWLDEDFLYQRILIGEKISQIRKYLTDEGRVFLNNIIVTLPPNTTFTDIDGGALSAKRLKAGDFIRVTIPTAPNNIGIIDGQHRIFSYHEGNDKYESRIRHLRPKQHLLVTAIIYPEDLAQAKQSAFEAKLFLEINDKQTRIKSTLKHVIYTVVHPYSDISIAKRVAQELSKVSPMDEVFEKHNFDKGKLSTTSIVSYGILYLTKPDGVESLYKIWKHPKKAKLLERKDKALLDEYIHFCATQIRYFLCGFKANISPDMWTIKQKKSKVLTATTINGLIHCMRLLVGASKTGDVDYYTKKFKNIEGKIDFTPGKFDYKSSHWKDLGTKMYKKCFR